MSSGCCRKKKKSGNRIQARTSVMYAAKAFKVGRGCGTIGDLITSWNNWQLPNLNTILSNVRSATEVI